MEVCDVFQEIVHLILNTLKVTWTRIGDNRLLEERQLLLFYWLDIIYFSRSFLYRRYVETFCYISWTTTIQSRETKLLQESTYFIGTTTSSAMNHKSRWLVILKINSSCGQCCSVLLNCCWMCLLWFTIYIYWYLYCSSDSCSTFICINLILVTNIKYLSSTREC